MHQKDNHAPAWSASLLNRRDDGFVADGKGRSCKASPICP
jgi:hypothetical protein